MLKEEIKRAEKENCPCGCGGKAKAEYVQISEAELKKDWIEIKPGFYKKKGNYILS